jgi:dCTP diphosphatase
VANVTPEKLGQLGAEMADVLWYLLLLGHDLNIDLLDALNQKLQRNQERYLVEKAQGNHRKYTEL